MRRVIIWKNGDSNPLQVTGVNVESETAPSSPDEGHVVIYSEDEVVKIKNSSGDVVTVDGSGGGGGGDVANPMTEDLDAGGFGISNINGVSTSGLAVAGQAAFTAICTGSTFTVTDDDMNERLYIDDIEVRINGATYSPEATGVYADQSNTFTETNTFQDAAYFSSTLCAVGASLASLPLNTTIGGNTPAMLEVNNVFSGDNSFSGLNEFSNHTTFSYGATFSSSDTNFNGGIVFGESVSLTPSPNHIALYLEGEVLKYKKSNDDIIILDGSGGSGDTSIVSATLPSTSVNNYNPSGFDTATTLLLNLSDHSTLTGLVPNDAKTLTIQNVSDYTLTLESDSASSSVGNKFAIDSFLQTATLEIASGKSVVMARFGDYWGVLYHTNNGYITHTAHQIFGSTCGLVVVTDGVTITGEGNGGSPLTVVGGGGEVTLTGNNNFTGDNTFNYAGILTFQLLSSGTATICSDMTFTYGLPILSENAIEPLSVPNASIALFNDDEILKYKLNNEEVYTIATLEGEITYVGQKTFTNTVFLPGAVFGDEDESYFSSKVTFNDNIGLNGSSPVGQLATLITSADTDATDLSTVISKYNSLAGKFNTLIAYLKTRGDITSA